MGLGGMDYSPLPPPTTKQGPLQENFLILVLCLKYSLKLFLILDLGPRYKLQWVLNKILKTPF